MRRRRAGGRTKETPRERGQPSERGPRRTRETRGQQTTTTTTTKRKRTLDILSPDGHLAIPPPATDHDAPLVLGPADAPDRSIMGLPAINLGPAAAVGPTPEEGERMVGRGGDEVGRGGTVGQSGEEVGVRERQKGSERHGGGWSQRERGKERLPPTSSPRPVQSISLGPQQASHSAP